MKFLLSCYFLISTTLFCHSAHAHEDLSQIKSSINKSLSKRLDSENDLESELNNRVLEVAEKSMMLSIQKTFLVSLEQILPHKYIGLNDLELSIYDFLGDENIIGKVNDTVSKVESEAVKKALPLVFLAFKKVSSHIQKHQSPNQIGEEECKRIYNIALMDVANYFVLFSDAYIEISRKLIDS